MQCGVCNAAPWKYKTSCCKVRYCSVVCYKRHFEALGCDAKREKEEPAAAGDAVPTPEPVKTPLPVERHEEVVPLGREAVVEKIGEEVLCGVCGDAKWRYKTPCCKVRYCSMPCYKEHFEVCGCAGERRETVDERQKRVVQKAEESLREAEVVDAGTLSSKQLEAISRDAKMQQLVKDANLRELIRNIDGDTDPLSRLDQAMESVPEFKAFTEHVANIMFLHEPPAKRRKMEEAIAQRELVEDITPAHGTEEDELSL